MYILDPCLILSQSLNRPNFLLMAKPTLHRIVGQNKDDSYANNSDESNDEKHNLPARKCLAVVMLEAKADQTPNDCASPSSKIPDSNSRRLFIAFIPHAGNKYETWGYGRLKDAKEDASSHQGAVVLACACDGHNKTPEGDHVPMYLAVGSRCMAYPCGNSTAM